MLGDGGEGGGEGGDKDEDTEGKGILWMEATSSSDNVEKGMITGSEVSAGELVEEREGVNRDEGLHDMEGDDTQDSTISFIFLLFNLL